MIEAKINDSGWTFTIDGLAKNAGNTAPLMRRISGDMMDAVEENFEREGRPKWKSLAESTIESRKRQKKWPGKILQIGGGRGLAGSITPRYSAKEAIVGTNLIYARIHQKGGMAGRGRKVKIPARPYLTITNQELADIENRILNHMTKGVA